MPDLTLLTVHAHPDDEASKGAPTVAMYHDRGVRTVLVTCTGGECGEILNPAMDSPEVREDIGAVRKAELEAAADIIGYDEVVWLGYRDSGMAGAPTNEDPRSFAQAPLDEAVGRLVEVIRRERPEVVITYQKEQTGYPHPDHIRVNEISELAVDAAGDPSVYPEAGEAFQPSKLYYVLWAPGRFRAMHEKFLELGLESPFAEERFVEMAKWAEEAEKQVTTVIDVSGYGNVSRRALIAHATQVDPTSKHWFGLPPEVSDELFPYDHYVLVRDLTGRPAAAEPGAKEDDLFAGLTAASY